MEAKILANTAIKMNLPPEKAKYLPAVVDLLSKVAGITKWEATRQIAYNPALRDYVFETLKNLSE